MTAGFRSWSTSAIDKMVFENKSKKNDRNMLLTAMHEKFKLFIATTRWDSLYLDFWNIYENYPESIILLTFVL